MSRLKALTILPSLLVLLLFAATARAADPLPNGWHGLRWDVTATHRTITSPTNYINAKLPDGVLIDDTATPGAAAALQAESGNSYINTTTWSSEIDEVGPDVPLQPVRLWQSSWATSGVPKYMRQLAGVLAAGVPIPLGWQPEADSDSEGVFYSPSLDQEWELWRLKPADPATNDGYAWTAQAGGRMSYVHSNPGHWVNRTNGAIYPALPTDPLKALTFEDHTWGATAAKLPLLELEITGEDVRAGEIDHAIGFAADPRYIAKYARWPAQGYDGYTSGAALQEGMRFRLPPDAVMPDGLTPLAQMIWKAARDYGVVLVDRAGSLSFRGTPDVRDMMDGVAPSSVLKGFPWSQLEVIQPGSDSNPNPVG